MHIFGLGLVRVDFHLYTPNYPGIGSEVKLNAVDLRIGGSVYNTFVTLKTLGVDTHLFSAIGNDVFGSILQKQIEKSGVNLTYYQTDRTALTVLIVDSTGEKTMYSYDPGHLRLSALDLRELDKYDAVHSSCYEISLVNQDNLVEILKIFASNEKHVFMDLSPTVNLINPSQWKAVLPYVSILLGNEQEINMLLDNLAMSTVTELITTFGIKKVYIKMGEYGSRLVTAYKTIYKNTEKLKSKNTTGCGDAFNGGVIWGELNGFDSETILERANNLAKQVIMDYNKIFALIKAQNTSK